MHFEVLVEDISGKVALEILLPKIIDMDLHTYTIHSYKGIGHIPKGMKNANEASKMLLNKLPLLLKGYGKTYSSDSYDAAVLVVCDLDNKNKDDFLKELQKILNNCNPAPATHFCLAIEEGEAWLLGDFAAVKSAYPRADRTVLKKYVNDSICGTWEKLADAVYDGGSAALMAKGYPLIGIEKSEWAKKICPHMDVNNNKSPSFNDFKSAIEEFVE